MSMLLEIRPVLRWMGRLRLMALVCAAALGGCSYTGVGSIELSPAVSPQDTGADPGAEPGEDATAIGTMTGTFDGVLTARRGDVYTFTVYRVPRNDEKYRHYFNRYKKDHPFTQAELVISVDTSGRVAPPILSMKQGDRVVLRGVLNGPVSVEPADDEMIVSGEGLDWVLDTDRAFADVPTQVGFEVRLANVLGGG